MNFPPFQTHRPLEFAFDPETGLVQMVVASKMSNPLAGEFDVPLTVFLGPETTQELLRQLPDLRRLLEEATRWSATPDSLQ